MVRPCEIQGLPSSPPFVPLVRFAWQLFSVVVLPAASTRTAVVEAKAVAGISGNVGEVNQMGFLGKLVVAADRTDLSG